MFRLDPDEYFLKPMPCPHKNCDVHVLNKEYLIVHLATHNKPKTLHWRKSQFPENPYDHILHVNEDPELTRLIKQSGKIEDAEYTYTLNGSKKWIVRSPRIVRGEQ